MHHWVTFARKIKSEVFVSVAMQPKKLGHKNKTGIRLVPPWFIEGGLYAVILYDYVLAPIFGLEVERLGIIILAGLASLCFLGFRERAGDFFRVLAFPVGLGISYILIQSMYHGESILVGYVKPFIPWIFTLIVVHALFFRRGFLHRYAIFALILGVIVLPFVELRAHGDELTRAALGAGMGPLSSTNSMAEWFGFCTVYFFVYGVAIQRQKTRVGAWIIATGCLLLVSLTVSRATLGATVIAILLGSRGFLKRGFLPVLLLVMLAGIAYGTGMFDRAIGLYMLRGVEETGRGFIWPKVIDSIINSPFVGVGASNVAVFLPESNMRMTPHNTFLFIGTAAGIIPVIFYAAYWIQAILAAITQQAGRPDTAAFYLPLVAFAFVICMFSNLTFLGPWVVVATAAAVTSHLQNRPVPPRVVRPNKN